MGPKEGWVTGSLTSVHVPKPLRPPKMNDSDDDEEEQEEEDEDEDEEEEEEEEDGARFDGSADDRRAERDAIASDGEGGSARGHDRLTS